MGLGPLMQVVLYLKLNKFNTKMDIIPWTTEPDNKEWELPFRRSRKIIFFEPSCDSLSWGSRRSSEAPSVVSK